MWVVFILEVSHTYNSIELARCVWQVSLILICRVGFLSLWSPIVRSFSTHHIKNNCVAHEGKMEEAAWAEVTLAALWTEGVCVSLHHCSYLARTYNSKNISIERS